MRFFLAILIITLSLAKDARSSVQPCPEPGTVYILHPAANLDHLPYEGRISEEIFEVILEVEFESNDISSVICITDHLVLNSWNITFTHQEGIRKHSSLKLFILKREFLI